MKLFTILLLQLLYPIITVGQCNSFPATSLDSDCATETPLSNNMNISSGVTFGICGNSNVLLSYTNISISGGTLKVCGNASISGNINNGVIIVACGATLNITSGITLNGNLGIVNYGTVIVTGNMTFQNNNNYFYNESNSSRLYVSGDLSFPQNNGQSAYLKNNGYISVSNNFNANDGGYTCLGPKSRIECNNLYYIINCGGPSNRFTYNGSSDPAIIRYNNINRLKASLTTSDLIHICRAPSANTIWLGGGCGSIGNAVVINSAPTIPNPAATSFCAVSNCFNILPISLIDFTGTSLKNGDNKISWTTSSEINNDYFTLERSLDGTEWAEVTKITGAGNSNQTLNYSTVDENPYPEITYYRLKQTDFNGEFEYSEITSVNNENLETLALKTYPNPAKNQTTLIGCLNEFEDLRIYNTQEQDVTKLIPQSMKNSEQLILDLSKLSKGFYYIKTKNNTTKLFKK